MANALNLLVLLASLTVWRSGADDVCDTVECLPAPQTVCALNKDSGSIAVFADECVLRCTNCRITSEFKMVNDSLCSAGTTYVSVCPDFPLSYGDEETEMANPGDGSVVIEVDMEQGGSAGYDKIPPFLGELLPLPQPLLSMGSEILRRLVMSSRPEPPPPSPEGLTLITADVKVDVTINMPPAPAPPPPPPPPAARFAPPPPLMLPPNLLLSLLREPKMAPPPPPPPPPQFLELRYQLLQPDVSSAAPQAVRHPTAATVASLVALIVAALHI